MNLKSLFLTFSALPMLGFGLPSGALVEHGQADFHTLHTSQLEISCADRTVINWDTFNIDSHEALKFIQSQGDAVLNRVTGHESGLQMSQIMGKLSSQGSVYIVNPEGILIGSNALIDVASFVATTLDISSADFLKLQSADSKSEGLQSLVLSGDSKAKILNLGTIKAASGDVHVVAYQVDNQGSIEATQGAVTLAAANEAVLQPAGKKRVLIRTRVASNTDENAEADLADEGVANSGVIKALEADIGADGSLYKLAINHTGHIEAKTLTEEGGKIFLTAEKGSITVDGTMIAKESIDGIEKGGRVEVMGERVALTEKAHVDISGKHGGGTALFGSDTQGEGTAFNAQHTTVAEGSFVNASATENGDGGKVIYWGDDLVNYHGSTLAEGGIEGGDGGFVEVSSHGAGFNKFIYTGHVSTLAPKGKTGTLLWDPDAVEIWKGSGTDIGVDSTTDGIYDFGANSYARIYAENLKGVLADNNVNITVDAGGSITFTADPLDATGMDLDANSTLTLTVPTGSGGGVYFDQGIASSDNLDIVINAPNVRIGALDRTSNLDVRIGSMNATLNQEGGSFTVYAGASKNTELITNGGLTIQDADGVTGSVLVESQSAANAYLNENSSSDINITVSGDVTARASGGGSSIAGIKHSINGSGAINIGTSSNRVRNVTLDAQNAGSYAFIGHNQSDTSAYTTSLGVYASQNVTLSTSGLYALATLYAYGTPATYDILGDVALTAVGSGAPYFGSHQNPSNTGPTVVRIGGELSLEAGYFLGGQASSSNVFEVGSFTLDGSANVEIVAISGYNPILTCSGNLAMLDSSFIDLQGSNEATLDVTGSESDITLTGGSAIRSASSKLIVNAERDINLAGFSKIVTSNGSSYDIYVTAGRDVVLQDTSYIRAGLLDSQGSNIIIVTDNANPSSPNAGSGNLTMASGAFLEAGYNNTGEVYVFAGYQENNNADINNNATINGETYGNLKGTLDTEDSNNKFGVYYNASELPSEYNVPATFYYKAFTPAETITEGTTEGASEVASAATSSSSLSIGAGISTLNNLRDSYITPTKSFHRQYSHMKKNPRIEAKPNKRPKKKEEASDS